MEASFVLVPNINSSQITSLAGVSIRATKRNLPAQVNSNNLIKRPVEILNSVIVGGYSASKKIPSVNFYLRKSVEVQVLTGIPISIKLNSLPRNSSINITFVSDKGKSAKLGRISTSKVGIAQLPPITLQSKNRFIAVGVQVGKKKYSFFLRTQP